MKLLTLILPFLINGDSLEVGRTDSVQLKEIRQLNLIVDSASVKLDSLLKHIEENKEEIKRKYRK